ncbi:hypothetical protein [Marinicella meishanensis]|uniref:hypothetical protein n=1 Tax=Marinicella meishanensis TaxID=2873263 RepID=UPI001CBF6BE1|nr:hypothetical protein [Marinicella sp. NBU2979]
MAEKYDPAVALQLVLTGPNLGRVLVSYLSDVNHAPLIAHFDGWTVALLLIIFMLIWDMSRFSRAAAVVMFVFVLLNQVLVFLETASIWAVAIGLLFLFFLGRGIKGTFDYHALMRQVNPEHQPTKRWMWVVFTPVALIAVWVLGLGALSHFKLIPAEHVKAKHEITAKERQALQDMYLVEADTEIEYFNTHGLFSLRTGGVLMTADELIIYAEVEGEIYYDSMRFEDMQWVKQLHAGGELENSVFQVAGTAQYTGFQFELSTTDNMDTVFFQALENKINPYPIDVKMPEPDFSLD